MTSANEYNLSIVCSFAVKGLYLEAQDIEKVINKTNDEHIIETVKSAAKIDSFAGRVIPIICDLDDEQDKDLYDDAMNTLYKISKK